MDYLLNNKLIVIMAMVAGAFIMAWVDRYVFWPETKTVIKESLTTDTVVVKKTSIDTIFIDRVKLKNRIDTIYYSTDLDADISLYEGVEDIEYGQLFWKAETTGQLVSLRLNPSLKIPEKTITNTVTRTEKTTIYNKGIYAGGMVNDKLLPSLSASYIDKKYSFDYQYSIPRKEHSIGVKIKIF